MNSSVDSEYEKQHVPESFNIYLATQQIIAILSAIIFIALLTVLEGSFDKTRVVTFTANISDLFVRFVGSKAVTLVANVFDLLIWLLTLTELSLLTALIAFHTTATQVFARWRIYFPRTLARGIGAVFMTLGIFLALLSIATILFLNGFGLLSIVCLAFAPLWIGLTFGMRRVKMA